MSGKKLFNNSIIYSGISILQKGIYFLLLPLYTSFLTTYDFGIVAIVTSIINVLSIIFGLALTASANRFYYEFNFDDKKVKSLFGTIFGFILVFSFLISIIFIVFNKYMLMPFAKGIQFYPYLLLGVVITFLSVPYTLFQSTLQAKQDGRLYGLNNISYFLLNIISTIILMVVFKLGANSILLSLLGTNFIFLWYTCHKFIPQIKLEINTKYLVPALKYSLPLVPHLLASWLMIMVNTLLINNLVGTASAGIYSVGFQLSNIINLVTSSVNQAFVPWFFSNMKENNSERVVRFAEIMVVIYSVLALALSFFAEFILNIMTTGKDFSSAWSVVAPLSFAFVFSGIYYFASAPLFYNTKTVKFIPAITITSALVNVPLNILLIPLFNIQGAAISSLISIMISAFMAHFLSIKYEPVRYRWTFMYLSVLICMIISTISFIHMDLLISIVSKILILTIISLLFLHRYRSDISTSLRMVFVRKQ